MGRLALLPVLFLAAFASAQDPSNPFGLGRAQDINARAMGLGGAYTAVASDGSALYYNAAGLSAVKKHEVGFSMERTVLNGIGRLDGYPSLHARQEDLRIQSATWLVPIPTSRGGLTFALGYYRPRNFADVAGYQDDQSAALGAYEYKADGSMDAWRAAFGVDLAPDIAFGLAVGAVTGSEEIRIEGTSKGTEGYLREYAGMDLEPSLMFKLSPRLKMGLSMVVWEHIFDLEQTYEVKDEGNSASHYRASFPFQIKSGVAYQGDSWLLSADARLNAWSQYQFAERGVSTYQKTGYQDELILAVGGEKFIRPANMVLRAGYTYNALPERGDYEPAYDLNRVSLGAGFLFSGSLSLDLAYSYSFWGWAGSGETAGQSLDNREHRALATFAFRY
jgi:long-subunit fatty acid transport protein